ncbi:MAG: TetR/AcrR family transcriptional regulator [Acidimicrobiia bacterium]|nr:TetR/AcrR family transcriptional regulator [Acidimicrobiia bacterium]
MPTSAAASRQAGYHHGDLPNALKAAAAEVITEKGPAGFSLREVARRAGVSHAAPAHHFGDTTGLLTALAVDAFRLLDEAMTVAAAAAEGPADRLARVGRAYVEVGLTNPAHLDIVFRPDLVNTSDPDYSEWGERAYGHLVDALEAIKQEMNPDLDVDDAARLCWSTVQGLIVLHPGMSSRDQRHGAGAEEIGDLAERFCQLLLVGLVSR